MERDLIRQVKLCEENRLAFTKYAKFFSLTFLKNKFFIKALIHFRASLQIHIRRYGVVIISRIWLSDNFSFRLSGNQWNCTGERLLIERTICFYFKSVGFRFFLIGKELLFCGFYIRSEQQ